MARKADISIRMRGLRVVKGCQSGWRQKAASSGGSLEPSEEAEAAGKKERKKREDMEIHPFVFNTRFFRKRLNISSFS